MNRTLRTLALAPVVTLVIAFVAGFAFAQPGPVGDWKGLLGPGIIDLEIRVTFTFEGAAYAGTIDIPAQGSFDLPLDLITVDDDAMTFAIPGIPGDPVFEGTLAGDRIEGTFTQGGQPLPFFLERGEPVDARPQTPRPPFPYDEEEVTFANGDVTLAGTLTLPPGDGPVPAVVLITGSGPQDRDEEILGHRPFLLLADQLTRAGVAVLRFDDRGVGGSSGNDAEATFEDIVGDVSAALDAAMAHPRVDATRVGLLGHSQGGYIAPVVAVERDDVAFVVLMAGPAVNGFDVLVLQNELIIERTLRGQGAPDDVIAAAVADQVAFLNALRPLLAAEDLDAAAALVRERVEAELANVPPAQRPAAEQIEEIITTQTQSTLSPVFRAFLDFDPQPWLRQLTVPTFAFFGGRDFQVPPEQNEGPMREALAAAGNPDATVRTFDGLNHLMQPATTGLTDEYGVIETTIDEAVLEAVVEWVTERVGLR